MVKTDTIRVPRHYLKVMLEFTKWEYVMNELRLERNYDNRIIEPYDSPNYQRVRMLGDIINELEVLLHIKKRERCEKQEVFDWYERRQQA